MRRVVAVAIVVAGLGACKRVDAPEPDPTPRPTPSATPAPMPSTDSSALAKSIAEATAKAKDCKEVERVVVPGGSGVMIRYTCGVMDLAQLVAPGQIVERRFAHLALEASVHGFWKPFGADKSYVAVRLTQCGAPEGCRSTSELTRFASGRFDEADVVSIPWPLRPASQIDFDHDGRAELVVPVWTLRLSKTPSGCTPAELASIEDADVEPKLAVDGLAAWSPTKTSFSTTLRSFAGWYSMQLSAARSEAKHLAVADAGTCSLETLRTASQIAIYGRVLGESASKVDGEADAIAASLPEWSNVRTSIASVTAAALVDVP